MQRALERSGATVRDIAKILRRSRHAHIAVMTHEVAAAFVRAA
jgi:hypothetical protein